MGFPTGIGVLFLNQIHFFVREDDSFVFGKTQSNPDNEFQAIYKASAEAITLLELNLREHMRSAIHVKGYHLTDLYVFLMVELALYILTDILRDLASRILLFLLGHTSTLADWDNIVSRFHNSMCKCLHSLPTCPNLIIVSLTTGITIRGCIITSRRTLPKEEDADPVLPPEARIGNRLKKWQRYKSGQWKH